MSECFERELDAYLDGAGVRYFSARELCPVGKVAGGVELQPVPRELWGHILPTLEILDWLREQVGPLTVNSAYRDPAYNKAVGGAADSRHVHFNAVDFRSRAKTPKQLAQILENHKFAQAFGIGIYKTFVHLDTRGVFGLPAPARWRG